MTIINPSERRFESQRLRAPGLIDSFYFKFFCRQQEVEQVGNDTWRWTVCPRLLQRLEVILPGSPWARHRHSVLLLYPKWRTGGDRDPTSDPGSSEQLIYPLSYSCPFTVVIWIFLTLLYSTVSTTLLIGTTLLYLADYFLRDSFDCWVCNKSGNSESTMMPSLCWKMFKTLKKNP